VPNPTVIPFCTAATALYAAACFAFMPMGF
jgi:hypothetical protein